MKRRVLVGALLWLVLVTLAHVHLNVGWGRLVQEAKVLLGRERAELVVGYLPVT